MERIKKFKLYFIIFFCVICIPFFSIAQTPKIDSLKNVLHSLSNGEGRGEVSDTTRINTFNALSEQLWRQGVFEKALQYANEAVALAKSLSFGEGFRERSLANAYNNIGIIYTNQGNYAQALENYFASLKIREETGDKKGIATSYGNIGNIYYNQGNYAQALENHFASLKISIEIGNKQDIAASYNNIGNIYYNQGNYDKASEKFFASLRISIEMGNKQDIAYSYMNIGVIYYMQAKQQRNPDSIGNNYGQALENYFASLKILEEIGDKDVIAGSYINIGSLNTDLKKYADAEKYLNKGLALSKEIGAKNLTKSSYEGLSQLDSTLGNWKGAYEYHKLFSEIKDSIFNEENSKQIHEMSTKYETEKKEKEIQLLNKDKEIAASENKKQKIISYSVSGGLLLVLLLAVFIFRTNKKLSVKNSIIEKQNLEIAHKNKDLTDSILYAERIQRAILTSEQYLNDMFLPQGQTASHFILYKPKDIVAGDFYWAYSPSPTPLSFGEGSGVRPGGGLCIWLTADCTGHGVPGAFMSMIGNSLLNEIVVEKQIHQPAEILNALRAGIIKAVGQSGSTGIKDGMDCALCCWDKQNNKIIFSGANNSLWILRNNEFIEINPDKQPVGNYTGQLVSFTQKEVELQQGDTLYTFTDGYADQFGGPKGKKFKYKPFKELLISIQHKSMPEQREILNKTIVHWRGEMEQIDDICVFGVRV